jgi:predicted MFS family arabinose efflux permease
VRWLISSYDWRIAMATIGIVSWVLLVPTALLVRRAPRAATAVAGDAAQVSGGGAPQLTAAAAFRSPQFLVLALTFFCCCAAHSGPIFHLVSYAIGCGIPAMAAVSIYSVEGLAGLGGRLLFGLLADRYGARRLVVLGLLMQSLAIITYLFANTLGEFYALSIVLGTAYGGVMPLYAVVAREYFGARIMGTVFGAAIMASSLGMAFGPWAGGWVFDTFRTYEWMYICSFGVALCAAAMALFFPARPVQLGQHAYSVP